jgi:hypothetical protein
MDIVGLEMLLASKLFATRIIVESERALPLLLGPTHRFHLCLFVSTQSPPKYSVHVDFFLQV